MMERLKVKQFSCFKQAWDLLPPAPPSSGCSHSLTSALVERRSPMTHSSLSLPQYTPPPRSRTHLSTRDQGSTPPSFAALLSRSLSPSVSLQENVRLFAERKKKNIFLTLGALSNFGVCGRNRLTRMLARRLGPVSSAAELFFPLALLPPSTPPEPFDGAERNLGNQRSRFMSLDVLHVLSFLTFLHFCFIFFNYFCGQRHSKHWSFLICLLPSSPTSSWSSQPPISTPSPEKPELTPPLPLSLSLLPHPGVDPAHPLHRLPSPRA